MVPIETLFYLSKKKWIKWTGFIGESDKVNKVDVQTGWNRSFDQKKIWSRLALCVVPPPLPKLKHRPTTARSYCLPCGVFRGEEWSKLRAFKFFLLEGRGMGDNACRAQRGDSGPWNGRALLGGPGRPSKFWKIEADVGYAFLKKFYNIWYQ